LNILLAIDGSKYTRRMLAYVAAHDEWLGAKHRYTVLTVVPLMHARAAAFTAHETIRRYYQQEQEAVLKPVRAFFARHRLDATFVGEAGDPAERIVAHARTGKPDLIVLGSHGRGHVAGLLMGSVATKVLATTKVPVLLVR
jgi:nucleotide-binding universal stress UspA family protein